MNPFQAEVRITRNILIAEETYALRFECEQLATQILPGQFINIRVNTSFDPLLRRPYSISNVYGNECEILFATVGKGTGILSKKKPGDSIHILGPLGNTFGYTKDFQTALIVAGGIGIAPFPLLIDELRRREKLIHSFIGARTKARVIDDLLPNTQIATDDGSEGFQGTVVSCLDAFLQDHAVDSPFIFACGPNAMLNAVQNYAGIMNIPCELSLESEMACGIGICQGCPVEHVGGERKYALVCTDGPCFDASKIIFHHEA